MKKNISINISGIIFHIEEDAYDKLKSYLDSINSYFASFDGSQEIIADIESRIAEIFLAKLGDDKQVITLEDVESLMATMGSIRDFQAVEEPEAEEQTYSQHSDETYTDSAGRKLFRDEQRKLVGGVCAGVAHYFTVDPLWIRLLFILLLVGSGGIVLVIYIIMWAVIPGSHTLEENKKLKKMFRDPSSKVLGGVAGGLANYFVIDVAVIRVLFVLSIFLGGAGLITYIILWMILPEAKTITDKVQMQGEPITLSNIETNIKSSLNVKEGEDENFFVKLLLFPFRLIAIILNGLGKALGPLMLFLVDFIRVAIGLLLIFIGIVTAFSVVVTGAVLLGIVSSNLWETNYIWGDLGIPLETLTSTFPAFTALAAFCAIMVPCLFLILLGSSVIVKRIIFSATVGWSLFAILGISVVVLAANIPAIAFQFREDGDYEVVNTYDLQDKTAVLKLNEVGMEGYNVTKLRLRGHEEPEYKLVQVFEAQGRSRRNAAENAQMITYNVSLEDSIFYFDSNVKFKEDALFRAQRLEMTLYVPHNKPFIMDDDMLHIIRNTIHRSGYHSDDVEGNIWMFTEAQGLVCTTCRNTPEESTYQNDHEETIGMDSTHDHIYSFDRFETVEIRGAYTVEVVRSNEFKVLIDDNGENIDDLMVRAESGKLDIGYEDPDQFDPDRLDREKIQIKILSPEIDEIDIAGASRVYMEDFDQSRMTINLSWAAFIKADIMVEDLEIEMTGASEMQLEGRGFELDVELTGASHLNAYDYEVRHARIEANAASSAKVNVSEELEVDENLASDVKNRGRARIRKD